MSAPTVSCIVPCFNGARFLAQALDSILAQTHRPIDVLVVDDGSTDASPEIAQRYTGSVRYARRVNGGPGAACNSGLEWTEGDYAAFLEQDDLWIEDKLALQLRAFEADPTLDYCVTHIQNFWVPGLASEAERWRNHPSMQPVPGYVVQTLMVRRRAFERVGRFDESLRFAFASDWFMRAEEAGLNGCLLPNLLTWRRLHEDNFSRRNRGASRDQFLHVIKSMLDRKREAR